MLTLCFAPICHDWMILGRKRSFRPDFDPEISIFIVAYPPSVHHCGLPLRKTRSSFNIDTLRICPMRDSQSRTRIHTSHSHAPKDSFFLKIQFSPAFLSKNRIVNADLKSAQKISATIREQFLNMKL